MGRDYQPAGFCPKCGYRIDPGTCPECGRQVKRPWRLHPRVVRRYRRLAILLVFVALGLAGWRYGPDFAAQHAPSSVLVWIWETDLAGADWARRVLISRIESGDPTGLALDAEVTDFAVRALEYSDPDWCGVYTHEMYERAGRRALILAESEYQLGFVSIIPLWLPVCTGVSFDGQTLRLQMPGDRDVLRWARNQHLRYPLISYFDPECTLIRWGDWRFLVAPDELIDFCNDVNAGEPLNEFHLTRVPPCTEDDGNLPSRPCTDEPPDLPPAYAAFILYEPVDFRIVSLRPRSLPTRGNIARLAANKALKRARADTFLFDLSVATDSRTAPFVGMRLYPLDRLGIAHITRIGPGICEARYVELSNAALHTPLAPGATLSTLAPLPVSIRGNANPGQRPARAFFKLPSLPTPTTTRPTDPDEIAERRRCIGMEDWLLRELARELRK